MIGSREKSNEFGGDKLESCTCHNLCTILVRPAWLAANILALEAFRVASPG